MAGVYGRSSGWVKKPPEFYTGTLEMWGNLLPKQRANIRKSPKIKAKRLAKGVAYNEALKIRNRESTRASYERNKLKYKATREAKKFREDEAKAVLLLLPSTANTPAETEHCVESSCTVVTAYLTPESMNNTTTPVGVAVVVATAVAVAV